VILHIGLPGMSGHEVARQLRQRPALRDVVLIALTGWGQEQDRRRSSAAGIAHHLTKPVDPDRLDRLLGALGKPRATAYDAPKKAWRLRRPSRRTISAANWLNAFDAETAEVA
jgi:CheY-like chemotaxis protein